jgi:gas vesicle protein
MSDSNDGFKVFLSLLTGAAIGAIVGLLFAPKPGKELREDLREFSEKLADDAKAEYVKMSAKAKDMGGRAKNVVEEAKGKFRKGGEESEPTS